MARPSAPTCPCLLDLPGDLPQGVIGSLRPTELVAVERVCPSLRGVVRAHPFVAWLRDHSDKTTWDKAWLKTNDETARACAEWGHPRLCAALARDGQFELLQWVRSHNPPCPWGWQTGWEAFKRGDTKMLEWLAAHEFDPKAELALGLKEEVASDMGEDDDGDGPPEDEGDLEYVGDLVLLKWMRMHDYDYFSLKDSNKRIRSRHFAVTFNGHLHVLQWLHEISAMLCLDSLCNRAGMGGGPHSGHRVAEPA
jgi:hypothetical protein